MMRAKVARRPQELHAIRAPSMSKIAYIPKTGQNCPISVSDNKFQLSKTSQNCFPANEVDSLFLFSPFVMRSCIDLSPSVLMIHLSISMKVRENVIVIRDNKP